MDREPPDGARRRWTTAELVSEQPAEQIPGWEPIRSGRSPTVMRERQMQHGLPDECMQTRMNQSGTA